MKKIPYAREQRLRFIDFLLAQYGFVNRSAIQDYFAVGPATATHDFRDYKELAPANLVYQISERAYYKTQKFKRLYP